MFGNLIREWWILELQTTTARDLEKMFLFSVIKKNVIRTKHHSQNHGLADAHSDVLKEHRSDVVVFFKGQTRKPEHTDGQHRNPWISFKRINRYRRSCFLKDSETALKITVQVSELPEWWRKELTRDLKWRWQISFLLC